MTPKSMIVTRRHMLIAGGSIALSPAIAHHARARETVTALTAMASERALLPGSAPSTAILGFDGRVPGPVLRARVGEPFTLSLANALDHATGLEVAGLRLDAPLAVKKILPDSRIEETFTPIRPGTSLYRAADWTDAERGLSGAFIVEERENQPFDRDEVLVLKDWLLDPSGAARVPDGLTPGNVLTVNGFAAPAGFGLSRFERVRLRLVNASALRVITVRASGSPMRVIALDGEPTEPFEPLDGLVVLAPGARADLIAEAGADPKPARLDAIIGDRAIPLARFTISDGAALRPAPLPPFLGLPALNLPRLDLKRAKRFAISIEGGPMPSGQPRLNGLPEPQGAAQAWSGQPWRLMGADKDPAKALFQARRGTSVVLTLGNHGAISNALHIEGHPARPLDALDDGVKPWLLDTILLNPGEQILVAFAAERAGRWRISAASPRLAAAGLTGWYEII